MPCPSSGTLGACIRNNLVEGFAVTSTFAAVQVLAAKFFRLPHRVPMLLGIVIPLSHYTFAIIDHQTKVSDKAVHHAKSQKQRYLFIFLISLITIRAYADTPYTISYRWALTSLCAAKIFTKL